MPEIGPDELLVRIDAIGLCFSDVKLIRAGEAHPRVISKDLKKDPVIPGHEAVMTVVKVGDKVADKFDVGQRFIIQADVYVNGRGFAYGYAINGGMEQYSVIDQRILNGDEGCYLLPISDDMPSAVAALLEPWTCVQASYMIENRTAPLPNGRVFIAAGDNQIYGAGEALKKAAPASVVGFGLAPEAVEALNAELGVKMTLVDEIPSGVQFDDIFLFLTYTDKQIFVLNFIHNISPFFDFLGDWGIPQRVIDTRCRFERKLSIQFPCSLRYATLSLPLFLFLLPFYLNAVPAPESHRSVVLLALFTQEVLAKSYPIQPVIQLQPTFGQQKKAGTQIFTDSAKGHTFPFVV